MRMCRTKLHSWISFLKLYVIIVEVCWGRLPLVWVMFAPSNRCCCFPYLDYIFPFHMWASSSSYSPATLSLLRLLFACCCLLWSMSFPFDGSRFAWPFRAWVDSVRMSSPVSHFELPWGCQLEGVHQSIRSQCKLRAQCIPLWFVWFWIICNF